MTPTARQAKRRDELVAALRRVAGARGIAQTNVRAVATEADVSVGSVLYYFSGFEELIFAALEGVMEEFYEQRRLIAEKTTDPVERMRAFIVAGIPDVISDDLRLVYESIAFVRERPEYGPLHRSIVDRQITLYRSAIEVGVAVGAFRPRDDVGAIARNLVALEDAYDLYPLIGLVHDRAACRASVLRYAELVLDCDLALEPGTGH